MSGSIQLSTFGVSATAEHVTSVTSKAEITQVVRHAKELDLPIWPVGEGSNTVLAGSDIDAYLLDVDVSGMRIIADTKRTVCVAVGAGVSWDNFVAKTVKNCWSGVESLSAIPGSVGAAPVQNIGAYGQELADTVQRVEVFDVKKEESYALERAGCNFGYRDSLFKQNPGRFIILSVTFKLSKQNPEIPDYDSVQEHFSQRSITNPTVKQIRDVVTDIRWSKLPRPEKTPNVGSFFKNPVVSQSKADNLQDVYADMPTYEQSEGVKIPAGWLIEEVGLKGEWFGSVGVSEDNALILISEKQAKFADLAEAISEIRHRVRMRFDIELEREPRVLC